MNWPNNWLVRWLRQNVIEPLVAVMKRGADPHTLALSIAVGITLGIFPIYGVTALLCTCAIALMGTRCNAPAMMIANFIATPLEVSLVVPFLRLGESIVGGKQFLLTRDALWKAVTGRASVDVLLGFFHAFLGWAIASPFIIAGAYFGLLPLMRVYVKRYGAQLKDLDPEVKDPLV